MKKIDKFTIVTKIENLCIIVAIIILTIRLLFSISSTSTVSNQQELSQSTTQSQQYNIQSIKLDTTTSLLKLSAISINNDTQDIQYNIPVELLKFPSQLNYHYYYQSDNVLLHISNGSLTIDKCDTLVN